LKSAEEIMEMLDAYDLTRMLHGAAVVGVGPSVTPRWS
jgi:hypothetical protein